MVGTVCLLHHSPLAPSALKSGLQTSLENAISRNRQTVRVHSDSSEGPVAFSTEDIAQPGGFVLLIYPVFSKKKLLFCNGFSRNKSQALFLSRYESESSSKKTFHIKKQDGHGHVSLFQTRHCHLAKLGQDPIAYPFLLLLKMMKAMSLMSRSFKVSWDWMIMVLLSLDKMHKYC